MPPIRLVVRHARRLYEAWETALRSRKKEQRALTQVWSSLKSLQRGN